MTIYGWENRLDDSNDLDAPLIPDESAAIKISYAAMIVGEIVDEPKFFDDVLPRMVGELYREWVRSGYDSPECRKAARDLCVAWDRMFG